MAKLLKILTNRGTGAGGANTNKSGLHFEKITSLDSEYDKLKIVPDNNKSLQTVFFKDYNVTPFLRPSKTYFRKFMETSNKCNKDIPLAEGAKQPDEVYIFETQTNKSQKYIFWIEKKNQKCNGSVCEKIQTGASKRKNLQLRYPKYKVYYIYVLSSYFKKHKWEISECKENNIPIFWGDEKDYKQNIIKFMHDELKE
jgi:hypothetical protein